MEAITTSNAGAVSKGLQRLRTVFSAAGVGYSVLYTLRRVVEQTGMLLDRALVRIEQRRGLIEPWAISSRRFTSTYLRDLYDKYDWPEKGEEWTKSQEWKDRIINNALIPNIAEGSTVVEIGPGGGRWTATLQQRAAKLFVIDVSARALSICKERFANCANIEYLLGDGHTIPLPDRSVDAVWSFDVFVHINPIDTLTYFREFQRVLKPGGRAIIHHPGSPTHVLKTRPGGRSDLTDVMVRNFVQELGFELICQTEDLVTNEGDVLTVFRKRL